MMELHAPFVMGGGGMGVGIQSSCVLKKAASRIIYITVCLQISITFPQIDILFLSLCIILYCVSTSERPPKIFLL